MGDNLHTLLHKLQFVFAGVLIIAIFFLLSLLVSSLKTTTSSSASPSSDTSMLSAASNANVITSGVANIATGIVQATHTATTAVQHGFSSAGSAIASGAKATGHAIKTGATTVARGIGNACLFVARGVGGAFMFVARGIGGGLVFVVNIPSNTLGLVSAAPGISSFIRPADSMEVPVIDPNSPELRAAVAALPPVENPNPALPQGNQGPVWPMHGAITTEFGTPHRPYQHTHTGMDISDGQRSGVTPIKPFRPGKVVDAIRSNRGLGNHVIVDHGNGVTSVYAHLYSIAVHIGQEVTIDTVLGTEGSTGVSTGTHLHFEIRVNGQAANPRHFISGQP
jgi:hypothetical protein